MRMRSKGEGFAPSALAQDRVLALRIHRDNLRRLESQLRTGESAGIVVQAAAGKIFVGALAATDTRLLLAMDRFGRRPQIISIPYDSVRTIELVKEPVLAKIIVEDDRGKVFLFRNIDPKDRADLLVNAIVARAPHIVRGTVQRPPTRRWKRLVVLVPLAIAFLVASFIPTIPNYARVLLTTGAIASLFRIFLHRPS